MTCSVSDCTSAAKRSTSVALSAKQSSKSVYSTLRRASRLQRCYEEKSGTTAEADELKGRGEDVKKLEVAMGKLEVLENAVVVRPKR